MNSLVARPECLIGCGFLMALAAAGALAGLLAPYDPWAASGPPFASPNWPHLLGTNDLGQDLLSEVVFGIRLSLSVGLIGAAVATFIGALVGLAAGYYRGWIDEALMGLTDTTMLIPALPLIILLVAYSGPSFWWIVAVIGLVWWTGTARAVRARVLQVREMPFVEASTALGARRWRTMLVHILPNLGPVLLARFTMAVPEAILTEAGLSFLGLGDPSVKSLGLTLNHAFTNGGLINGQWWWYLFPIMAISAIVLSVSLLGIGSQANPE